MMRNFLFLILVLPAILLCCANFVSAAPASPVIEFATVNMGDEKLIPLVVPVITGNDPAGRSVKVTCTATNSNYDDDDQKYDSLQHPPYKSYVNGGTKIFVPFIFNKAGLQKVTCTTSNDLGESSVAAAAYVDIYVYKPFLTRPYHYDDMEGIISFCDHLYPDQETKTVGNMDHFARKIRDHMDQNGYSYYHGHEGFDYRLSNEDIFAAAPGKIITIDNDTYYGNHIEIEHDINFDGVADYVTNYAHLQSNQFAENLRVGDSVSQATVLGLAGSTGRNVTAAHLHFDVKRIYRDETGNKIELGLFGPIVDPYGWWNVDSSEDPWINGTGYRGERSSQNSHRIHKASRFLWISDSLVDDRSNGFQYFNHKSYPWTFVDDSSAFGAKALYTRAEYQPEYRWANWAFWWAELPKAGQYALLIHVPKKPDGLEVSSKVQYKVFSQARGPVGAGRRIQEITINQKAISDNGGGWIIAPGNYYCERYDSCAVMLIDEVTDSKEKDKVIWADAVQWLALDSNEGRRFLDVEEPKNIDSLTEKEKQSLWYLPYLYNLDDDALISGYSVGGKRLFLPNNSITRAEFLKLILAADEVTEVQLQAAARSPFVDASSSNDWFFKYVNYAYAKGIVTGLAAGKNCDGLPTENIGDKYFCPNRAISRAEAVKLAVNLISDQELTDQEKEAASELKDVNQDDWFYKDNSLAIAIKHKIIQGYTPGLKCDGSREEGSDNRYFCPNKNVVRAEAVKIIDLVREASCGGFWCSFF